MQLQIGSNELPFVNKCLSQIPKGGFFSKSVFQMSKSQKKKDPNDYPELEITVKNKFKFQAQDSYLEYLRFEK